MDKKPSYEGLEQNVKELEKAQNKLKFINALHKGALNLSRITTREKDLDRLIQKVCDNLISSAGYASAWVALSDDQDRIGATFNAGFNGDFAPMEEYLREGKMTPCWSHALEGHGLRVVHNPPSECGGCPLAPAYKGMGALVARLGHNGEFYGLIVVSSRSIFLGDEESREIFFQIARYISNIVYTVHLKQEREQQEARLQQKEAMLRSIFRSAPAGIGVTQDKVFKQANDRLCEMVGYSQEELLGKSNKMIYPDDKTFDSAEREKYRQMEEQKTATIETRWRRKDGKIIEVSLNASPFETDGLSGDVIFTALDVTEANRLEADRRRLERAIDQAFDMVIITDAEGPTIQYVNPAFEKTTGFSFEKIAGENPRILKSGEQDESFYRQLWETLTSGENWQGRFVNRRKDGSLYTVEASISPIFSKSGDITNYIAVQRDISNQLAVEAQLQRAHKMESIGLLVGGIAHDFNNLLQAIYGYTQILLMEKEPDDPDLNHLTGIEKATKGAVDLIQQLLTFGRKVESKRRPVHLNQEIRQAAKLLRRVIPKMIDIEFNLADGLKTINADPVQMEQILMNLSVNARDAMPGGGKMVIETKNVAMDEEY
ncbi:MAG: PAS domain S-box protein [Deltaproteobacteria bacterium]|nr:PAS domain S-box protein [Deltaproteobacteria bacterium]MBW1796669.1 PAS domain S-box protein [Deltaproteobacteria bacterium]